MKICKDAKQRIDSIRTEACEAQRKLMILLARLSEHSGTKRMAVKLERAIHKLDDFIRA